ncbi:MAG: ribosomal RNA small subunit methyltransferase A [Candidatus Taylorbacteria bacterium]|nr:ribosomal RNA small subunit methyltransferase A [Candidatus Taylorbacteria bacterium]
MKSPRSPKARQGAKLGQHLLTNVGIARAVAVAAGVTNGDKVLEIGPGKGMLTKEILLLGGIVTAVEKDPGMVAVLREKFAEEICNSKLIIHEGDARDLTPDKLFPKGTYKIAANIPYYITGELIRSCLTAKNKPVSLALLVQKEVAVRIARSKKESILSLSVKAYGTPKYIKTVSRGSFNPPPSVDSAILAVYDISNKNFKKIAEKDFFRIVKAGFAQKRKTLAGNLKRALDINAVEALDAVGISEKVRAEDLTPEEWLALTKYLAR